MRFFLILLASLAVTGGFEATFTALEPGDDDRYSYSHGVNDAGTVVGHANRLLGPGSYGQTGVRWIDGRREWLLPPQEDRYSQAWGINNDGIVVGTGDGPRADGLCCYRYALRWAVDGSVSTLPMPHVAAVARDINDRGEIAGSVVMPSGWRSYYRATVWRGGTYQLLEAPTDRHSEAFGIDDDGLAVGLIHRPTGNQAAVWSPDGSLQVIGAVPGQLHAYLWSIEDGVAGGWAYVLRGGTYTNVPIRWTAAAGVEELSPPPGADWAVARGVGGDGHLVGYSHIPGEGTVGVLWDESGAHTLTAGRGAYAWSLSDSGAFVGGWWLPPTTSYWHPGLWTLAPPNPAPAIASMADVAGAEGDTLTFTADASDPEGEAITHAWDFGDGATSTGAAPRHAYADEGDYEVTLTVTDPAGKTATATATAHVENAAPVVSVDDAEALQEEPYFFRGTFTDAGRADGPWTYEIRWNDGGTENAVNGGRVDAMPGEDAAFGATHTFLEPGEFEVTVTVEDGDGGVGTATATIRVEPSNHPPVASAGGPYETREGGEVTFDGSGSTDPDVDDVLSFAWTFGDLGTAEGPTPAFTFHDDAEVPVRLTVTDGGGLTAEAITAVTVVNVAPTVDAGGAASVDEGGAFTRTGSFADPGADDWTATIDWGAGPAALALDGFAFSLGATFADDAERTVRVVVRDDDGGEGEATIPLTVRNVAPIVTMPSGSALVEGDAWSGTGSFADPGADTWNATTDWGDGPRNLALEGKAFALARTFADDAQLDVTVRVSDDDGGTGEGTARLAVANAAPVVDAGPDVELFSGDVLPLAFSFTDRGELDAPWTWSADWGAGSAGGSSEAQGVVEAAGPRLTASGTYAVRLSVTDKDGGLGEDAFSLVVRRRPVGVDVRPESVSLGGNGNGKGNGGGAGTLSVAILSVAGFDATTLDPASVRVGDGAGEDVGVAVKNNGTWHAAAEDVDGDGRPDLVAHVDRQALVDAGELTPSTTALTLRAETLRGVEVEGGDAVRVVP